MKLSKWSISTPIGTKDMKATAFGHKGTQCLTFLYLVFSSKWSK